MAWATPPQRSGIPDLDVLSNDTPRTPATWTSFDDDLESAEHTPFDESSCDDIWQQLERRRSSGVAVQNLLSQIDGTGSLAALDPDISAAVMNGEDLLQSPSWKVVIETSFASKYFRNDRKNIQCFPTCTLGSQQGNNGGDEVTGHGKSTTWCRGAVNARAFAIDPEINLADISMFEAFGAFVMGEENPKTVSLSVLTDRVRASLRKVDGRSFEIKLSSTVWKFDPPLSKKKSDEQRNRCNFIVVVLFKGREVGRCASPPFDLASQKAAMRLMKKRTLAQEESPWGAKQLVLDSFAQASMWAKQHMGYASPKPSNGKTAAEVVAVVDAQEEKEPDETSLETRIVETKTTQDKGKPSAPAKYPVASRNTEVSHFHSQLDIEQQSEAVDPPLASVVAPPEKVQSKRVSVALLLWLPPFGLFGAHHVYLGRARYGFASALTMNMLLFGWLLDAVRLPMLVYNANFPSPASKASMSFMSAIEFFLLWLLFGLLGGHRYALGDTKTGLIFTFTLGGLGLLWLWDGFHLEGLRQKGLTPA